jgi:hypothetical protein
MAGTIVADTLTHSTAGSIWIRLMLVNGSAKALVNFTQMESTQTIRSSKHF